MKLRKFLVNRGPPCRVGSKTAVKFVSADTAVNHFDSLRVSRGIMGQRVLENVPRYRDDPVPAQHDGAVGADRVLAMYRGDQCRAMFFPDFSQCEVTNPGGKSRMSVNDVGLMLFQPVGHASNVAQCRQALAANGPFKNLSPGFSDLPGKRAIAADNGYAVPPLDQAGADFSRDPF